MGSAEPRENATEIFRDGYPFGNAPARRDPSATGYPVWMSRGRAIAATFALSLLSAGAHPGYAATHLQAAGPELAGRAFQARAWAGFTKLVAQSAAAGAWPSLYAATNPDVRPGSYYGPGFFEYRGKPALALPNRTAQDPELA